MNTERKPRTLGQRLTWSRHNIWKEHLCLSWLFAPPAHTIPLWFPVWPVSSHKGASNDSALSGEKWVFFLAESVNYEILILGLRRLSMSAEHSLMPLADELFQTGTSEWRAQLWLLPHKHACPWGQWMWLWFPCLTWLTCLARSLLKIMSLSPGVISRACSPSQSVHSQGCVLIESLQVPSAPQNCQLNTTFFDFVPGIIYFWGGQTLLGKSLGSEGKPASLLGEDLPQGIGPHWLYLWWFFLYLSIIVTLPESCLWWLAFWIYFVNLFEETTNYH